jgi:hypothetical protein
MPDCTYCDASFDDEAAYLDHLAAEHRGELGTIDRRRVENREGGGDDEETPIGPIALGAVLAISVAVVVYVIFFVGGGSASDGPGEVGTLHEHGTINVTIAGETLDFTESKWLMPREYPRFHFEDRSGNWHVHAEGVTLEYAMDTLGIGVTDSSVTYNGTTYRASDSGTEVVVQVNGNDVDPSEYVLTGARDPRQSQQGDHIRIVVRQN